MTKFYNIINPLCMKKMNVFQENNKPAVLRDWLLTMIMYGQFSVKWMDRLKALHIRLNRLQMHFHM